MDGRRQRDALHSLQTRPSAHRLVENKLKLCRDINLTPVVMLMKGLAQQCT